MLAGLQLEAIFDELAETSLMSPLICRVAIVKFSHIFQVEWHITQLEQLCDIRPDCHHHFAASETLNALFEELAERFLMGTLAGTKHTYVRPAILKFSHFFKVSFGKKVFLELL